MLMTAVDHLVCSQKFALQFAQTEQQAFNQLSKITTHLVITLGDCRVNDSSWNIKLYL